MASQRSKRLEITLVSGQDLPLIARNLTTYAVAYIKPDYKLTTQIDNVGHTNPNWNHKFVFHLDPDFSVSEDDTDTAVTFEIYNVGWLRDFLVGSATIPVSNLVAKRPMNRPFTAQLHRPTTGLLQGVLNIRANKIDRSDRNNDNVRREIVSHDPIEKDDFSEYGDYKMDDKIGLWEYEDRKMDKKKKLERSSSERTARFEDFSVPVEDVGDGGFQVLNRSKSGISVTDIESVNSLMRPLPSEVVAALTGKNVFGVKKVGREPRGEKKELKAVVENLRQVAMDDKTPVVDDRRSRTSDRHQRRKKAAPGMFSCFGNVQGREFGITCGNNEPAKRRTRKPRV